MAAGIYQIVNLLTGKVYIGSSINIDERWRLHRKQLKRGNHHSYKLQWAFNDGSQFNWEILETVEVSTDRECLLLLEQIYLDYYRPFYNVNDNVFGCLNLKDRSKEWIVCDPDGQEVTIRSLSAYCENRNLSAPNMIKVANGKIGQHKGYKCRRPEDLIYRFVPNVYHSGREKAGKLLARAYIITHPDGREENIIGLNAFCKVHGLNRDTMRHAMARKGTYKGFRARRVDIPDPI